MKLISDSKLLNMSWKQPLTRYMFKIEFNHTLVLSVLLIRNDFNSGLIPSIIFIERILTSMNYIKRF